MLCQRLASVARCWGRGACGPRCFASAAASDAVDQMISYAREHYQVRKNV